MIAALVNAVAILVGSLIGLQLKDKVKPELTHPVMVAVGLCTLVIGLDNSFKTSNILIVIISLALGTFLGEYLRIQQKLEVFSERLSSKVGKRQQDNLFSQGFISASLLFCVGAMAVIGSIDAGVSKNYQTIFSKSIMDFIASIILSSTFGMGVAFSSVAVLLYQGGLTLFARILAPYLNTMLINELSAVGGIMLLGTAVNILKLKEESIFVMNMMPSLIMPVFIMPLVNIINSFF